MRKLHILTRRKTCAGENHIEELARIPFKVIGKIKTSFFSQSHMLHRVHGQRPVPFCIFHLYKFKIKMYNLYLCLYAMGLCRKAFLQIFTVYVQSKSSTLINTLFVVVSFHICSGSLCKLAVGLSVNVNLPTPEHTPSFTFHNILSHLKYVNWLYSRK